MGSTAPYAISGRFCGQDYDSSFDWIETLRALVNIDEQYPGTGYTQKECQDYSSYLAELVVCVQREIEREKELSYDIPYIQYICTVPYYSTVPYGAVR